MGVSAAIFETAGKRSEHYVPGTYSRSHNVTSPVGVSAGNLCILGKSLGGEPGKLLGFSSLAEAKNVLIGGDLLEAVGHAFKGSNTYIPSRVYAMRVNNGTQAELTLKTGETPILKLKAWDYGTHTNQLKLWLEQGTNEGLKVSVLYKNTEYSYDNIVKESISIQYIGENENSSATVQADKLVLETGGESSTKLELSWVDYPSLAELVARINDTDDFYAVVVDSNAEAKTENLDTVTITDLREEKTLKSELYELTKVLKSCPLISSVEFVGGSSKTVPEQGTSYQYFTGGTVGDYTVLQWMETLEKLETEDVQIIATPVTDSSVQVLISSHCTEMSGVDAKKERTCWLGGLIGESDDEAIEKAKGFNNKLVSYVVDSAIASNPLTGETETISGAMLACKLAGMESAMAVNEPLTNKTINVLGFQKKRTIGNMGDLIKAGVVVCNPSVDSPDNYVCIRAVTTYQGEGDLISCERSMTREDLYMNRDLRKRFASSIGTPGNGSTSSIIQTLKDAAREWAVAGYIIPSGSDNVWDIRVRIDGDKVYLEFSRYLTAPRNFVFLTATNSVYTSEVAL